ncbi:UNVERIFIED_CONTAM: hypothetical protein PYX00_008428 [Menopon gallinae]|uniref:Fanconi anemia core complex-associated protein 24 pseudonuclease domain-containing protein n=1 Tax=Menopon gallinae TaxID=328185 RepID=A0AAW2HNP1_9NEOP
MVTPVRGKFSVPPGGILIHKKWRNTKLTNDLRAVFNTISHGDIDPYDFLLYGDKPVIYIPESDLVTVINPGKYTNARKDATIIAIRNTITAEQYSNLQDALVINNDLKLIPLGDPSEIPELLHQLSFTDSTPKKSVITDYPQINMLLTIPGLGKQKAEKLLNTFGTIERIASSPVSELSSAVGLNLAAEVYNYFN